MAQVHWAAPTFMVASFLVSIAFALGHHFFYASLNGEPAPTSLENHNVLGMQVSAQQVNIAIGTAFAFLVRTFLVLSISVAYFQILMWTVKKNGTKGKTLAQLDVMTSALQDFVSLANFKIWWRRPWLWVLAVIAWLIPIASVITPATLSVGTKIPLPEYMNVPNIAFSSLNLVAPMASYGTSGGDDPGFWYQYEGPSLTVQRIANAVAAQGSILTVPAPSVNSSWDLDFNGPSLHCNPVDSAFRDAVLANILNYTFARKQGTMQENCTAGPGFIAWHPEFMSPDKSMTEYLPFLLDKVNPTQNASDGESDVMNSYSDALNNDKRYGYPYTDTASVFLAVAPTLFSTSSAGDENGPTMCRKKPWYQEGLTTYNRTSTVLRCDLHNSTYHTTFSFVNGVQEVNITNVTDITETPMITIAQALAYFNSSNQTDPSLQPKACPLSNKSNSGDCLFDLQVLTTLSYQAIMHAFTGLVTGMISLGDAQDLATMITSTTQLSSTVLATTPELAFLQIAQTQNPDTPEPVQQRATAWTQQPFSGLVNAAAATTSTLPFQQALEQVFQNITISLMSAPDLQPNRSSIFYPNQTEVRLATYESIYVFAAQKLWLAYGLALGATALIISFGMAAIVANDASFSNKFSTLLRLSRGAQLSHEIEQTDLSGHDPLPAYAKTATVTFSEEQTLRARNSNAYMLVDREGKDDNRQITIEVTRSEQT